MDLKKVISFDFRAACLSQDEKIWVLSFKP